MSVNNLIQQVLGNPGKYSVQELQRMMKDGLLPSYVVVPIIQDKVQQQKQMQQAQSLQQPPVSQQPSIAQQIMQEAANSQPQGVPSLSSNLPAEYARGGIVSFDEGGTAYGTAVEGSEGDAQAIEEAKKRKAQEVGFAMRMGAPEAAWRPYYAPSANNPPNPAPSGYAVPNVSGSPFDEFLMLSNQAARGEVGTPPTPMGVPQQTIDYKPPTPPTPAAPPAAPQQSYPRVSTGKPVDYNQQLLNTLSTVKNQATNLLGQTGKSTVDLLNEQKLQQAKDFATGEATLRKVFAESKVPGQAYEGLQRELQKQAENEGAEKEQAKNMAIFKAGLAMMAGTSPHALVNIGQGALVGADDYQKAADKLKKAAEQRTMLMAHIEQARRAEQLGERDKAMALEVQIYESKRKFEDNFMTALTHAGIGDRRVAADIYSHALSGGLHFAGQVTNAQINAQKAAQIANAHMAMEQKKIDVQEARLDAATKAAENRAYQQGIKLISEQEKQQVLKEALGPLPKMPDTSSPAYSIVKKKFDAGMKALALSKATVDVGGTTANYPLATPTGTSPFSLNDVYKNLGQ